MKISCLLAHVHCMHMQPDVDEVVEVEEEVVEVSSDEEFFDANDNDTEDFMMAPDLPTKPSTAAMKAPLSKEIAVVGVYVHKLPRPLQSPRTALNPPRLSCTSLKSSNKGKLYGLGTAHWPGHCTLAWALCKVIIVAWGLYRGIKVAWGQHQGGLGTV